MADCIAPSTLSDISRKDTSRLVGVIAKALAANSPYINILEGGTFPSETSDEIRTSVQLQAAPGDSLAVPTFVCDTDLCGTQGLQDLTDAIDFTARLESKRGKGPRVATNVFFQVGSSATLGTTSVFKGTIMALTSITAQTGANIEGRLLARNGAVTLDTNAVVIPV